MLKNTRRFWVGLLILTMAGSQLLIKSAQAAPLTEMTTTFSSNVTDQATDIIIEYRRPDFTGFGPGNFFTYDFPDGFTASSGWQETDFALVDASVSKVIFNVTSGPGATPDCLTSSGTDEVAVSVDTTTNVFKVLACANYANEGGYPLVTFTIYGTAPDGTFTNPSVAANYTLDILFDGGTENTGSTTFDIFLSESSIITATVDPYVQFELGGTDCSLGNLSTESVSSCAIQITINTNAVGGVLTTFSDANPSTPGLLRTGGSGEIGAVTGNVVNAGSAEFGVGLSFDLYGYGMSDTRYDAEATALGCDGNESTPITTSETTLLDSPDSGGTDSIGALYICFAASIDPVTPAGTYTQTTKFTTTARF